MPPRDAAAHAPAHVGPAIASACLILAGTFASLTLAGNQVLTYGLPGYLRIIDTLTATGWPRRAFWPHGGHLFSLHLVAALGLGGAELTPLAFHPFHGPPSGLPVVAGHIHPSDVPGIGFELHNEAWQAFRSL
jgi:D(-)-tartrate dehydratase